MMKRKPKRLRRSRRELRLRKALSWMLIFTLTAPLCSAAFVHATQTDTGLCEHHPEHTPDCGYAEAVEGAPCTHVHDEACGYVKPEEGMPCTHVHDGDCGYIEAVEAVECSLGCTETDGDGNVVHAPDCAFREAAEGAACTHEHDESCGYVKPVEGADCTHVHDADCGYIEAVEGAACTFVCEICAAEADADPDAGTIETVVEPKIVSGWSWADEEVFVEQGEDGVWGLGVPNVSAEAPLTAEALTDLLPRTVTLQTADGGEETAALTWDLTAIPAEGVSEGSYTLKAILPEGYALADGVPAMSVLLDLGGGETYDLIVKYVNQWSFRDNYDHPVDEIHVIEVAVPSLENYDQVVGLIKGSLPTQIKCWGTLGWQLNAGGFVEAKDTDRMFEANGKEYFPTSYGWGRVPIQWKTEGLPGQLQFDKEYTLTAYVEPKVTETTTYQIIVNGNTVEAGNSQNNPDLMQIKVVLHQLALSSHIVRGINPAATTVNLFDYWVDQDGAEGNDRLPKSRKHYNLETPAKLVERTEKEDWNKGINAGRLFLFGDGNIHAGFWNKGAGAISGYGQKYAGMMGIVEKNLSDGYPVVDVEQIDKKLDDHTLISDWELCGDHNEDKVHNSDTPQNVSKDVIAAWEASQNSASLDYLFNPELDTEYRRVYEDVKGLFQLDDHGYYYYDMRRNYAEFSQEGGNHFVLYDAPAVDRTDGLYDPGTDKFEEQRRSIGNFFPFNKGAEVFTGVDENGKLTSSAAVQSSNLKNTSANMMNHHLGMTVSVRFRQPARGMINTGASGQVPMTFQFSGDDDVWIFIDDVLVLDLGGIHSEIFGTIDFSTGEVLIGQSWKTNGFPYNSDGTVNMNELRKAAIPTLSTNLKDLFTKAGAEIKAEEWSGNTFAAETGHVLKMFYLERGNYDSSLALRFNLQPELFQYIRKVDQNGDPIEGITFDLYPAEEAQKGEAGAVECLYTDSDVKNGETFYIKQAAGGAMATLTTGPDGIAQFQPDNSESPFNFAELNCDYFILKERQPPDGYRTLPTDIVLHYDRSNVMLTVANRWTTGAYACSISAVTGTGSLTYGSIEPGTGNVTAGEHIVTPQRQEEGLVVAVPMLLQKSKGTWMALYGSNIGGFQAEEVKEGQNVDTWRRAVLRAALKQAMGRDIPQWYLSWDGNDRRLSGSLTDLPGLASRYQLNNDTGDMRMVYAIIEKGALDALGVSGADAEARYQSLGAMLRGGMSIEDAVDRIMSVSVSNTGSGKGFSFLNTSQFIRNFRSLIYIPNEQRELWVMKVDEKGAPRNGAEFGLYTDPRCMGAPVSRGTTGTVDGQEGVLIFSPRDERGSGHAKIEWASSKNVRYYLKEISAPNGLKINETIIPVVVGTYSIYAGAGTKGDGVSVMAGVGRLTQTMQQYASNGIVNITLRDITAYGQFQPSENKNVLPGDWKDMELKTTLEGKKVLRSMNLHYGLNAVINYGLHDIDGGKIYKPFFVTDTGYIRARVEQNYEALADPSSKYEPVNTDTNKDRLDGVDLTNLFSLLNIVVVTDQPAGSVTTGQLTARKDVTGSTDTEDYTKNFSFRISLTDKDGKPLTGSYNFWGTDKAGTLRNGDTIVLHHDEEITVRGLPEGTRYTVTELPESGWNTRPSSGTTGGSIITGETASAEFTNSRNPIPEDPDTPNPPDQPEPPGGGGGGGGGGTPPPTPVDPPPKEKPKDPETPEVPPETPETPPETPETPPETPETPPANPGLPTELPDPNDPNAPDEITIWEDGVPKTYVRIWDPEEEEYVWIPEDEVPLDMRLDTGDESGTGLWLLLAAASGAGAALLALQERRKKKSEDA